MLYHNGAKDIPASKLVRVCVCVCVYVCVRVCMCVCVRVCVIERFLVEWLAGLQCMVSLIYVRHYVILYLNIFVF